MATTISIRELSEDAMRAVAADSDGPVIVTEEGRPAHVVLSYDGYCALLEGRTGSLTNRTNADQAPDANARRSLVDMLAMPDLDTLPDDYEFPKAEFHFQIPDLED